MFTLSILTDNAAFEDRPASEIARILRIVAASVERGFADGKCVDVNGNVVGAYGVRKRRKVAS